MVNIGIIARSLFNKTNVHKILNPNSYSLFIRYLSNNGPKDAFLRAYSNIIGDVSSFNLKNLKPIDVPDPNAIIGNLVFEQMRDPLVSVVIPAYNNYHLTHNCIRSLIEHKGTVPFEIVVADDNSHDETTRITEHISGIRVVRNDVNQGFIGNCNNASKHCGCKYIMFLNNDTQVCDGWLDSLVEIMDSDESIGIVGSKLLYPDGSLQEAGSIVWADGSAWNYGKGSSPFGHQYNYVKDVDYVSGASILVRKKYFDEIGGFDVRYAPAYCEDSDLSMAMRARGYRTVYQPKSVVYHFEGMSNGKSTDRGLKRYQVTNIEKMKEKWKQELLKDHCDDKTCFFHARERSMGRKTVLFITNIVPEFDSDAGSRNVYDYVCCLLRLGANVKILAYDYHDSCYCGMFQSMGVEVVYGYGTADRGKTWIADNGRYIDYVMVFHPDVAQFYLKTIRNDSNAKIYYNVADLHYLRLAREYEITGSRKHFQESEKIRDVEESMITGSDKCVTVSAFEHGIISKMIGGNRTVLAPVFCFENCDIGERPVCDSHSIMFVGGFIHRPNIDAVEYFVRDVLPIVRRKVPDVKFYIIGHMPTASIRNLSSDTVIVCGHVSDEELAQHYRSNAVCVAPLRYGAGVKGKIIEAMYHKIPIVSTSVGLEGIQDIDDILSPKDDPESFAEEIVRILCDKDYAQRMSRSYLPCLEKNYSMEKMRKIFSEEFGL